MTIYRIAGKFGRGEVSQIDSFRAFGERKFGELIDQPKGYQVLIWMVLVWQIMDDAPNLPNFLPDKLPVIAIRFTIEQSNS